MRVPFNLRYLHEKPLPRYPLWYPNNPRTRLFLPLFWLRMVPNPLKTPDNFLTFECHWQMTSDDVKQYLEKLYSTKVLDVRINIIQGEYEKHPKKGAAVLTPPLPDRKYAHVQLNGETFKFPDIFAKKRPSGELNKDENQVRNEMIKKENNERLRPFIGNWFF